jgi:hypothetical protein
MRGLDFGHTGAGYVEEDPPRFRHEVFAACSVPPTLAHDLEGRDRGILGKLLGAPGGIRTPDPQIRSLTLYPAELQARVTVK